MDPSKKEIHKRTQQVASQTFVLIQQDYLEHPKDAEPFIEVLATAVHPVVIALSKEAQEPFLNDKQAMNSIRHIVEKKYFLEKKSIVKDLEEARFITTLADSGICVAYLTLDEIYDSMIRTFGTPEGAADAEFTRRFGTGPGGKVRKTGFFASLCKSTYGFLEVGTFDTIRTDIEATAYWKHQAERYAQAYQRVHAEPAK